MISKQIATHINHDGILDLKVPLNIKDQDVEVSIIITEAGHKNKPTASNSLNSFRGKLRNSTHLNEDPLALQQKMRDEWT